MSGRARRAVRERRAASRRDWLRRLEDLIAWAAKIGLPAEDLKRMRRSL